MNRKEIVGELYRRNILVTADLLDLVMADKTLDEVLDYVKLNTQQSSTSSQNTTQANLPPPVQISTKNTSEGTLTIVKSYVDKLKQVTAQDFIDHFAFRLSKISAILKKRSELNDVVSISRIVSKTENEKVAMIGYVKEKILTKNEHYMLTIEDKTGEIKCLAIKNKKEVHDVAKNLVDDDIVGIMGSFNVDKENPNNKVVFIDQILLPDIPNALPYKKGPIDEYAVFIGDIHVGAKVFLHEAFDKFLTWINQDSEYRNDIAAKTKYLFVVGDIIEGVGVYPNQENDLTIIDARDQYKEAARLFDKIPKHIKVIICPGNHDVMRLAEPQPPLSTEFAKDLKELSNVICVSSPSTINIGAAPGFNGFNVLLYHGNSFFYYLDVEEIRKSGGINKIDSVMEFLLKRRHLAPSHTSNQYMPDPDRDEMMIEEIPDFFVTGHIHKSVVRNYKVVTMMSCSCFVNVTDYQKKQGMVPDLAKVVAINLRTRDTTVLDFL